MSEENKRMTYSRLRTPGIPADRIAEFYARVARTPGEQKDVLYGLLAFASDPVYVGLIAEPNEANYRAFISAFHLTLSANNPGQYEENCRLLLNHLGTLVAAVRTLAYQRMSRVHAQYKPEVMHLLSHSREMLELNLGLPDNAWFDFVTGMGSDCDISAESLENKSMMFSRLAAFAIADIARFYNWVARTGKAHKVLLFDLLAYADDVLLRDLIEEVDEQVFRAFLNGFYLPGKIENLYEFLENRRLLFGHLATLALDVRRDAFRRLASIHGGYKATIFEMLANDREMLELNLGVNDVVWGNFLTAFGFDKPPAAQPATTPTHTHGGGGGGGKHKGKKKGKGPGSTPTPATPAPGTP